MNTNYPVGRKLEPSTRIRNPCMAKGLENIHDPSYSTYSLMSRLDDLLSFLHPIPITDHTAKSRARVMTSSKSVASSSQPSITAGLSMLGQPPTMVTAINHPKLSNDSQHSCESSAPDSEDSIGLRALVATLDPELECDSKHKFDPSVYILRERLDERETMLMDGMLKHCSPLMSL
jgi:hypothetical protein